MESESETTAASGQPPVPLWQQVLALAGGPLLAVVYAELEWSGNPDPQRRWQEYLFSLGLRLFIGWLLALPVCFAFGRWDIGGSLLRAIRSLFPALGRPAGCAAICGTVAAAVTIGFGWPVKDLPPLYHDEYSYLFQAWTFLAGRLSVPATALTSFFEQPHVLADGVWVSRYFPGTALWLVPFLAAGLPVAGWWVATALVAGLTALVGCRFSLAAGYSAGLLLALAPGMVVLGNLLLSPMPTMLAFGVFLWAYFGLFESPPLNPATGGRLPGAVRIPFARKTLRALLAGLAMGFAFLTRPLTAAGLGFPFAAYSVYRLWRLPVPHYRARFSALVAGFSVGVIALAGYNRATTGSGWESPYDHYMQTRTPSHQYGFYNKERGLLQRRPTTFTAYDNWAEDLTVPGAARVVAARTWGLAQWSLGVVPVLCFLLLALLQFSTFDDRVILLLLAIASLGAAYVPYWFTGVFGFSYLAEAMPPLALVLGIMLDRLHRDWQRRGRPLMGWWWHSLVGAFVGLNLIVQLPGTFDAESDSVYPRRQAGELQRLERQATRFGPILVLVDADPKDSLASTWVYNRPMLDGPVVRAWFRGGETDQLLAAFPNRDVYLFRPAKEGRPPEWRRLRSRPLAK